MKNNQKNNVIAVVLVILAILVGYYVFSTPSNDQNLQSSSGSGMGKTTVSGDVPARPTSLEGLTLPPEN